MALPSLKIKQPKVKGVPKPKIGVKLKRGTPEIKGLGGLKF